MNDNIFASVQDQADKLVAPAVALAKLNIANFETLVGLGIGTLRALTDLNIARTRQVIAVNDVDGVKALAESQGDFVRQVGEKLVADGSVVVELAKTYSADVQKIAQESAEIVLPKAA